MNRAAFEIKRNAVERYYFVLKNEAGDQLMVSGSFNDRPQLERRLANIRETAHIAAVTTSFEEEKPPMFHIGLDEKGYFFILVNFDMEIIYQSGYFSSPSDCMNILIQIKTLSFDAGVNDLA